MTSRTPLLLAASALLSLILGSASVPETSTAAPPTSRSCFWGHDVENFAALPDQQTVYLRVGSRRVYELKLFAPCPDIDWNQRIGLLARGGGDWICEGSGLEAEIIAHTYGIGRRRCQVTSVRHLSPDEVAALPKKYQP
jgi:hypothetical protein